MPGVTRRCEACHRGFEVRRGSLIKVCQREDCIAARRAATKERFKVTRRERRHLDRVSPIWAEVEEFFELVAAMDRPGREDLADAVVQVSRARGAPETREALLEVAAVAMRWAGSLPKKGQVIEREKARDMDLAA